MIAWQTPAEAAATALGTEEYESGPKGLVETVLAEIAEPDRDMLEAGAVAIEDSFPFRISPRNRREIAARIWRAMFDRVRR